MSVILRVWHEERTKIRTAESNKKTTFFFSITYHLLLYGSCSLGMSVEISLGTTLTNTATPMPRTVLLFWDRLRRIGTAVYWTLVLHERSVEWQVTSGEWHKKVSREKIKSVEHGVTRGTKSSLLFPRHSTMVTHLSLDTRHSVLGPVISFIFEARRAKWGNLVINCRISIPLTAVAPPPHS
jgi:hypothetical protein